MTGPAGTATESTLASDAVAAQLGYRFVERRDVFAEQQSDGAYHPVRRAITMGDLRDHIAGRRTYGHYLVSQEGMCRVFVLDIDLRQPRPMDDTPFQPCWVDDDDVGHEYNPRMAWLEEDHPARMELGIKLRCLAECLARRAHELCECPVTVAYSGSKGIHVSALVGQMPARDVIAAADMVLDSFDLFTPSRGSNFFRADPSSGYAIAEIERFPKQSEVSDVGNLCRLPLGVNRKSGQRGFFLDIDKGHWPFVADDPLLALTEGSVR